MKAIWKFELETPNLKITMPVGAKILCVQMQHDNLCIWAQVDPDVPQVERTFMIVGTGHEISFTNGEYIGTVQAKGGALVWHLYELV